MTRAPGICALSPEPPAWVVGGKAGHGFGSFPERRCILLHQLGDIQSQYVRRNQVHTAPYVDSIPRSELSCDAATAASSVVAPVQRHSRSGGSCPLRRGPLGLAARSRGPCKQGVRVFSQWRRYCAEIYTSQLVKGLGFRQQLVQGQKSDEEK